MIDLFGLGKQQDPQELHNPSELSSALQTAAPEPAAQALAPRNSHKLWAFLLVLDSVFVIVFAGAVAAKLYQHWKAPASPLILAPRKRTVKTMEAPVASTAPVAHAAEPVKAPEPPKLAPAAAAKPAADTPRPPKPSMLTQAPKHRETPNLAAPPPTSVPAGGKVRALRTEFSIHAPKAKAVELIGAFIIRGGRKDMIRQEDGTWTLTLYLNPGSYRYFFSIDKSKQLDPKNPHSDKGASLLTLP